MYHIEQHGSGYYVVSTDTGKKHSKEPLTKKMANAQMKALYVNVKDAKIGKK